MKKRKAEYELENIENILVSKDLQQDTKFSAFLDSSISAAKYKSEILQYIIGTYSKDIYDARDIQLIKKVISQAFNIFYKPVNSHAIECIVDILWTCRNLPGAWYHKDYNPLGCNDHLFFSEYE